MIIFCWNKVMISDKILNMQTGLLLVYLERNFVILNLFLKDDLILLGCHILVTTPPSLLRMLDFEKPLTNLSRCCHLVTTIFRRFWSWFKTPYSFIWFRFICWHYTKSVIRYLFDVSKFLQTHAPITKTHTLFKSSIDISTTL